MKKTNSLPVLVEETKKKLVHVINESGLPACVVELIIKNIHNECFQAAANEYKNSIMEEEHGDKA